MTFLVKCLAISQYNSNNTVSGKSGTGKYGIGNRVQMSKQVEIAHFQFYSLEWSVGG